MEDRITERNHGLAIIASAQLAALLLGTIFWLVLALLIHSLAYGNLSWLVAIATILSTICTFGLGKTVITHLSAENKNEILSGTVAIVFILSMIAGVVVAIVLEPALGLLTVGLSLFSITVHLDLANRNYGNYFRAWVGTRLLSLFLPIIFYLYWGTITWILVGMAVAYLFFGVKAMLHLRLKPDFRKILGTIRFTVGVLGTDISRVSISFFDKVLIGELFGMVVLGLYHFAFRIYLLFGFLPQIMFFYLLSEKSAGRNTKKIEKFGIIASFGLAVSIYLFAYFVIPLAFPAFIGSINAVQIMGLAIIPATLVAIKTASHYSERKSNIIFLSHLLALGIGIAGIILLGKKFGLEGLAISMLILQCSLSIFLFILPRLERESRKIVAGLVTTLILIVLILGSIIAEKPQINIKGNTVHGKGMAMGTEINITAIDKDIKRAESAVRNAFDIVFKIDALMSATDKSSEIYILNQSAGDWVYLSPETIQVLQRSLYFAKISDGAFDPTVKPLVDLWMEKVKAWGRIPTSAELSEAIMLVNWQNLEIDGDNGRARFLREGMAITLGGIAKGYAVDRASDLLMERGIERALVDIGGDIRGFGAENWRIAIQHPRYEYEWIDVIDLNNSAVATSGDYRQFFLLGERRVHHILDPKTGQPAVAVMSVTVIAENCLDADALTTLVFVLGPEKGNELLNSLGVAGLIVDSAGLIIMSEAWVNNKNEALLSNIH